ncbi:anti-phage ZorAB system protein ZorA [Desulfovibrio sp. ZJ200]|uniref:anti-phage ZorAB system protein ZorA n=1 Tax=Desulfovibrio sp. ZJ200 TaxID=2709792 RepID=UPI0013EC91B1|nr:anti-phage ZorAB system protein ZorA [Desulfovibrio sp. ZJ200]
MADANEIINIIWTFLEPLRGIYTSIHSNPTTLLTKLFIEIIFFTFILIVGSTVLRGISSSRWIGRAERILTGFRNTDTDKEQFLQAVPARYSLFAASLSEYDGKLYLYQDCDSVLSDLWYPSILRSYLLPAGAALLTGIGVLGTFLGLLIGIQDLDLEDLGAIHTGIINIAGGASTAFETSVWGVALSLLLTVIEKLVSACVKWQYLNYQKKVAANFPPLPLGSIFLDIKKETGESRNVLNGLAEQISNNMQTSLDSFIQKLLDNLSGSIATASSSISSAISDSLVEAIKTTMAPAINNIAQAAQDLADRQARGSEEALGALLQSFSGKLTEEGDNQRAAMQAASRELGAQASQLGQITQEMGERMRDFMADLATKQAAEASAQEARAKAFENGARKTFEEYSALLQTSGQQFNGQMEGVQALLDQASQLQDSVREEHKKLQELAYAMSASSSSLEKASGRLDAFAGNIQASIEKNAQSVEESVALLNGIEKRQADATARLQNLLGQAKTVQDGLVQSSASLTSSMKQVMDNFNRLTLAYDTLQQNMSNSINEIGERATEQTNELAKHMTDLLTEFGKKLHAGINDRMNEWNEQTRTFCDDMTAVVKVMSDIVDDLDNGQKNGSSRRGR